MCNGLNHQPGCECGFGPPYPGSIELISSTTWTEESADNKAAFIRRLNDLNLPSPWLRSFLREYNSIRMLPELEDSISERIKKIVGRLEYRVEETTTIPINIPLFKLHSPSVKNAKVLYRESNVPTKRGWFVTVFGTGTGDTKTVKVSYDPDFMSERGRCVQIFVPIVLRVQLIGVYKLDKLQSRGIRAEIEGLKEEGTLRKRGQEILPKEECADKGALGDHITENFALSDLNNTKVKKFSRALTFNAARTIRLYLERFNLSFHTLAAIEHDQSLELDFELPGNHDYQLCFNSAGLHWDIVR